MMISFLDATNTEMDTQRDAVGRICVQDGVGRMCAGVDLCHVTTASALPPGALPAVASYALDLPTNPRKRRKFDAEVDAMVRRITGRPAKVLVRASDDRM